MQRGLKHIILLFIFIVVFGIGSNVNAVNFEKACGVVFDKQMQVTIKFETNDGESLNNLNYCRGCGAKRFKLPTPVKKGYIFKGWYADSRLEIPVGNIYDKVETEKIATLYPYSLGCNIKKAYVVLYAKWEVDDSCEIPTSYKVTINYQTDSDDKFDDLKLIIGEDNTKISLPTPSKEGYNFIGWYGEKEYRTLIKNDELTQEEMYKKIKTTYSNNDKCSFERKGTLYARYVDNNELISMIIDAADNNTFMINDLLK